MAKEKKLFKDCEQGDTLYYIVPTEELKIIEVTFKEKHHYYGEASYTIVLKGSGVDSVHNCVDGRSRKDNLFTTKEEAEEFRGKIINGKKIFLKVKKGDTAYIVKRGETEVFKVLFENDYKNGTPLKLHFEKCYSHLYPNPFEDKDDDYYFGDNIRIDFKIFLNENDALKSINDAVKRQKKNATDKYLKSIENYDGKLIALKDNAGSDLHYGDTVVYIRRVGYNGHPELRKGKIVGESKTMITVLDENEKKEGIPTGWLRGENRESDGKHSVQSQSVMLFKVAEVNTNSGFVFVK